MAIITALANPRAFLGYMGPSSSWSFCRRVFTLIGQRLPEASSPPSPFHPDGQAFSMKWKPLGLDECPDVSHLPPLDYTLFLFNSVKFYFGPSFRIIDEASFTENLHELYKDPAQKASTSRHWYAQYLLILAFGKAFIGQNNSHAGPPGHHYAVRAMGLLPDMSGLPPNPMHAIEALTLAAIYLQSVDMRVAAFQHVRSDTPLHGPLVLTSALHQDRTRVAHCHNRRHAPTHARGCCWSRLLIPLQHCLLGHIHA